MTRPDPKKRPRKFARPTHRFLLPYSIVPRSPSLKLQLRRTEEKLARAERRIDKIKTQHYVLVVQAIEAAEKMNTLLVELSYYRVQYEAALVLLEQLKVENEGLKRKIESDLSPAEPFNIRAWMASFKDLAPYAFASLGILVLAAFIVLDRTKPAETLARDDRPIPVWDEKDYDFREQKVRDLEKNHPPGDKTVDEWLAELKRAEKAQRLYPNSKNEPTFMGGKKQEPGEHQWRVE